MQVPVAHVDAVDQHAAALHVVEAVEQLDDRRLAGAGGTDDGDLLARLDDEGHVAQHPVLAAVGEPDVVELDAAAHARAARTRRRPGCAIAGGVSSSSKTRSADDMADCITAYFVEKSRIGTKNFCMYSMKATSVPNASAPARIWPPPYQTMSGEARSS